MKLKQRAILLLSLLFMTFGTVCFTQLTSAEVKVIGVALYWDEESTNPVSSIDFGILTTGQSRFVTFWLKNNSTGKGRISWESANFNPSSNGIAECWERKIGRFRHISNWNKKMKTGDLWEIRYTILVAQNIKVGVYSWDLIVRYSPSHSSLVIDLVVSCILTIAL